METLTPRMDAEVIWRTMVRDVVCAREQWLSNAGAGRDVLTPLIEWEIKISAYEVASGDKISDAVRLATIMDHAPEPLKATLCQSPLDQRRTVDALKLWTREASYVLPGLFQGQVLVPVSAVGDGGKARRARARARRARTGVKTRSPTRRTMAASQQAAEFQGCCSHCAKWSHKRAEWRTQLAQM